MEHAGHNPVIPSSEAHPQPLKPSADQIGILDELQQEIEAVEALCSYLNQGALQASIHLLRAGKLYCLARGESDAYLPDVLISQGLLNDHSTERVKKIWNTISTVGAYTSSPKDGTILISDEDVLSVVTLIRRGAKILRRDIVSASGLIAVLFDSPSLLLALLLPILFYSVGFIYTKSINPITWFRSDLEGFAVVSSSQDWGGLRVNRAVSGQALQVAGRIYKSGFGTHANSTIKLNLTRPAKFLSGKCGVDDGNKQEGSIVCIISSGGSELFRSPIIRGQMRPVEFRISVVDKKTIEFIVKDGGDGITYDHADWIDLALE